MVDVKLRQKYSDWIRRQIESVNLDTDLIINIYDNWILWQIEKDFKKREKNDIFFPMDFCA